MRLALATKLAVVAEDSAAAVDTVVAEVVKVEEEGMGDEDQRVTVASNHRHSTYSKRVRSRLSIYDLNV